MRNCTLFDMLRFHAYPLAKMYQADATFEQWERYLDRAGDRLNRSFSNPLDYRELKYTGTLSDEQFSRLQAERGAKGGRISAKSRTAAAEAKGSSISEQMSQLRSKGVSDSEPWKALGISRATWYRRQKKSETNEAIVRQTP